MRKLSFNTPDEKFESLIQKFRQNFNNILNTDIAKNLPAIEKERKKNSRCIPYYTGFFGYNFNFYNIFVCKYGC